MDRDPVRWSDEVDDVIRGDLTAVAAYVTPAGGAVAVGITPCGLSDREQGTLGFTTSLGFGKKLERIVRDPHVAVAYHSREHGFSTSRCYVLAQGNASVDLEPSAVRLKEFGPQVTRFLGELKQGPVWDRLLREYYAERVFVDIDVTRVVTWPDLSASGEPEVAGAALPESPPPQAEPRFGTGPRADPAMVAGRLSSLPHRLLAWRGSDGFPVVVPVALAGHDHTGLRLVAPPGLLPPGGRRAGLVAHAYRPRLVGLATRILTGWLEVGDDGSAVYAPHTSKGFRAPPDKNLLLVSNGLMAKVGHWQSRRSGAAERLRALAEESRRDTPS
jgi:hypothetical protein